VKPERTAEIPEAADLAKLNDPAIPDSNQRQVVIERQPASATGGN
jgi:hypothetical protein